MKLKIGKWLDNSGPENDVVLSTRIRFARNLKNIPFEIKASQADQISVLEMVGYALEDLDLLKTGKLLNSQDLTLLYTQYLLERHLVSPDFAGSKLRHALYVDDDETLSMMVNEEDHIRYQVIASGLDFAGSLNRIVEFDDKLESELDFAYSADLGFLTACPTNVGTGMRASVLIHLPGLVLTKEIEKVLRGVIQIGLAVRGLYGEGTETKGNFFQVSNQQSLGRSETEIIEILDKAVRQVIQYERKAREYLGQNVKLEIEDKVYRAEAILKSARIITSEETMNFLGILRLGVIMAMIAEVDLKTINELMIITKPANLQIFYNQEMEPNERDEKRASLIRNRLLNREKPNG
ncbi:MAG: protein arginine kinase [candidate division WOR-3 bacterium]|nr:protein arginine kinase [candidate division WOR-3 bacterium]